jgi:hypothetical protein
MRPYPQSLDARAGGGVVLSTARTISTRIKKIIATVLASTSGRIKLFELVESSATVEFLRGEASATVGLSLATEVG